MEHRPELLLQAALKSLKDNVLPAVDATNELAVQQLQISIGLMQIALDILPIMYRYDRQDLSRLVDLAQSLSDIAAHANPGLDAALDDARSVLDRARADPGEMLDTIRCMRTEISAATTAGQSLDDQEKVRAIRKAVVEAAREMIERERAWVKMYGFEADAKAIPDIEDILEPVS